MSSSTNYTKTAKKTKLQLEIQRCIELLEPLPLTKAQKIQFSDLLKKEENRSWFLGWSDDELRLGWVKSKLGLAVCSCFSTLLLLFFPKC